MVEGSIHWMAGPSNRREDDSINEVATACLLKASTNESVVDMRCALAISLRDSKAFPAIAAYLQMLRSCIS